MIQISLDADVRTEKGKGAARKLRQDGKIPGVIYGPGHEPVPLSVNERDFNRVIYKAQGEQVIFTLNLKNNGDSREQLAVVKEVQRHPVSDRIRHIDFYAISAEQKVKVEVPIKIVGKAKGIEFHGGVLETLERTLTISCLPFDIPREIEVDITELDVGDALHVSDLTPPEGIKFMDPPETTIVTVVGGAVEEPEEEEVEELEGEEAAAAEAPEDSSGQEE